ncbi:MAG: Mur ligase domain-containing protein, partial [Spongiibacteraceae bacterium]
MMMAMTLDHIARCTGGKLLGSENPSIVAVSTDSRRVANGELFVALRGENFDGAEFTPAAAQCGATAVMQERSTEVLPCVLVDDSLRALGLLARENRRQFSGPVIGITGSSGKTST